MISQDTDSPLIGLLLRFSFSCVDLFLFLFSLGFNILFTIYYISVSLAADEFSQ